MKTAVTAAAAKAVGDAVALIGNPGLTRANPLERHYRDVLCSRIHTPPGRRRVRDGRPDGSRSTRRRSSMRKDKPRHDAFHP
ncbi:acyl-CoA dehydrogenase, type 2, C-terminal domain [Parafrankia sp. EAN1pec]|nr:acyl-CoA dehydrogenase, type 2, C-terminal domain [Frankia sp. EAN1pec]